MIVLRVRNSTSRPINRDLGSFGVDKGREHNETREVKGLRVRSLSRTGGWDVRDLYARGVGVGFHGKVPRHSVDSAPFRVRNGAVVLSIPVHPPYALLCRG